MNYRIVPVRLHGDSFYSGTHSFLFHCVPKVASRSILKVCRTACPDGWRIAEKGYYDNKFFSKVKDDLYRFAFVRHPFSRLLSFYFDKFVNYDGSQGKKDMFARFKKLTPSSTLKELIAWLATPEGDDRDADPHYCSQHIYVCTSDGKRAVDYLGYFDQLGAGMEHVRSHLGMPPFELPELNSNLGAVRKHPVNTAAGDYTKYLDEADLKILAKRYEADLDLLGFKTALTPA